MNPSNTYAPGLISPEQFQSSGLLPSAPQSDPQAQQPQAPAAPHHSGNWFTHLLPTIGGIGGSILGGLATAGLGGEVAGGAGGSALGKTIENALEGKQVLQGDDLTAGLEGAAGAGMGGVASKILGKVAGEEAAGSGIAGALEKRAGNITNAADKGAAQQAEVDAAQATRNNYGIADKLQGGNHLALGTNQNIIKGLGYDPTDPYQMAKAAEAGYHPTDLSLNHIYDEALQNAKPVDMSGFGNDVYKTMQQTGTTDLSTSPLGRALQDFHTKTDGAYSSDTGINLPQDMNAADVRKLQQAIGRESGRQQTIINAADMNGQPNIAAESAHSTLSNLYDQLGSKIKTPEVDQAIAARTTTPDERAALVAKFGDLHGNQIADTIDKAQGAQDLLDPMQSYTQMSKAGEMGIDNIKNKTGTQLSINRAKTDVNGDGVADVVAPGANPLQVASDAHSANGPLGTVLAIGKHAANNPGLLNVMSRIGALGAKLAPATGIAAATAPNLAADPVAMAGQTNGTMGGIMQPNGQSPMDQLYQTLLAHYQAGGGIGSNDGAVIGALNSLAPQVQHNHMLATQLSGMPGLYANAGGAQGVGGILSQISGLIPGTAAHTYNAQRANVAHQLGIDPSMLPGLMQNGDTSALSSGIMGQLQGQLAY